MDIVNLAPNMFLYRFREHYEVNMLVLVDGNRCMLLDTGVTPQGKLLLEALTKRGLTAALIVNSHYHPDHINGNRFFPEVQTWGSKWHTESETPHQPPSRTLGQGDIGEFGPFRFRFVEARGHCSHQLITIINETWAFIGDLLMTGFDGEYWLPYIASEGDIDNYLEDLDMVTNLTVPTLIPSHGLVIDSLAKKVDLVKHYRYYLEKLRELGPGHSPEKYLLDDKQILHNWHQRNLDNIFK